MKQTTKVLAININHDELVDISNAFNKMIEKTDLKNMAEAMNVLGPKRSFEVTEEKLNEEIQKCYGEVMDSLGPVNDDGSIDNDLLDYSSAGSGTLGFILELKFDREKEHWIWTLNLEVSSLYIYPTEDASINTTIEEQAKKMAERTLAREKNLKNSIKEHIQSRISNNEYEIF